MPQIIPKRCKKPMLQPDTDGNRPPRWWGGRNFVWLKRWARASENGKAMGRRKTRYYMGRAKLAKR